MDATVTDARENRRGNGMEVPCKYIRNGPKTFLSKAEYIITDIVSQRQTNLWIEMEGLPSYRDHRTGQYFNYFTLFSKFEDPSFPHCIVHSAVAEPYVNTP